MRYALLLCALSVAGCASLDPVDAVDSGQPPAREHDGDRFARINRASYRFNLALDRNLFGPVAGFYDDKTPVVIKHRVTNFFENLRGPIDISNNLLQAKFKRGLSGIGRLLINSTIGLGGIFDVAEKIGMPRYPEDFGQTLATWGVPPGPYLVLPILGPSNMRDAAGIAADWRINPLTQYNDTSTRNSLMVFYEIDKRSRWPSLYERELERSPGYEYEVTRNFYEQDRRGEIAEGDPSDYLDDWTYPANQADETAVTDIAEE